MGDCDFEVWCFGFGEERLLKRFGVVFGCGMRVVRLLGYCGWV